MNPNPTIPTLNIATNLPIVWARRLQVFGQAALEVIFLPLAQSCIS